MVGNGRDGVDTRNDESRSSLKLPLGTGKAIRINIGKHVHVITDLNDSIDLINR